jgi:hypothetical protein
MKNTGKGVAAVSKLSWRLITVREWRFERDRKIGPTKLQELKLRTRRFGRDLASEWHQSPLLDISTPSR